MVERARSPLPRLVSDDVWEPLGPGSVDSQSVPETGVSNRLRAAGLKAADTAERVARAFERAAESHERHAAIAVEAGLVLEDAQRSREQSQRLRASARREREIASRQHAIAGKLFVSISSNRMVSAERPASK
jgi:hypothetical protein